MNRSLKIYLGIFAVVVVLITILEFNKTEVIDWQKHFALDKKSPFGLYIFQQEADKLLDNQLKRTYLSPYDYFEKDSLQPKQNLLLINKYVTPEGWNKIFSRVNTGDHAFIIETGFDYYVADSLGFELNRVRWDTDNRMELLDEKFRKDSIYIDKIAGNMGITYIDTLSTRILGTCLNSENEKRANFVEIQYGKGKFFFHTEPMVLTNFYLLKEDKYQYVEDIFSYLPKQKTIWFQDSDVTESQSPLRFVLENPPLRYAWYLLLFGTLIFVIFHAKRRQRIVPVIEPLRNSSAEFVKTIGNLYLQEGNYKDMAQKKATYFLNKVRTDLLMDTHTLDENFIHKLQLKTGAKEKTIREAVPLLEKAMHAQAPVQEHELLKMNELLDNIYK